MAAETNGRPRVFVSYSHKDGEWLERLRVHLKPLERRYKSDVDIWDDSKIQPGTPWLEEIRVALRTARAAILLVSADFLASDFVNAEELPALLESARSGGTDILIVILSPSMFDSVECLSRLQTVNDPKTPLIGMDKLKQEEIFLSVAYLVEVSLKRKASDSMHEAALATAGVAGPAADCRDYASIFDIYVNRERKAILFVYAMLVLSPLVGLALIVGGGFMLYINQKPAIVAVMLVIAAAALVLSAVLVKRVGSMYAAIKSCELMKDQFDGCEAWDVDELRNHVQLAFDFLKGGALNS
jgi:hypothetical protein